MEQPKAPEKESIRTGTSPETLAQALLDNLYYVQGRTADLATRNDWYMALAYTVRDRLLGRVVIDHDDSGRGRGARDGG